MMQYQRATESHLAPSSGWWDVYVATLGNIGLKAIIRSTSC